jgi:hypothetical protein
MNLQNIPLTKSDFESSQWEELINKCDEKECNKYSTIFFEKAREAETADNKTLQEVFSLLNNITSMMFDPSCTTDPFSSVWGMPDPLSSFSENHLNVLSEIVNDVKDAEMRARIADILWLRKRDYRHAELAIDSYLQSASISEHAKEWNEYIDRIERAFCLAMLLGRKHKCFDMVIQRITDDLDKYDYESTDHMYIPRNLMSFLLEVPTGDVKKYSELSEKMATRIESYEIFDEARSCWEIKAKWHKYDRDTENERAALKQAAETHAKAAAAVVKKESPSYLIAVHHQIKAVEAYRRIGGEKKYVDKLHKDLLQYQEKSADQMETVSFNSKIDIDAFVKDSIDKIKGKSLNDALFEFSLLVRSPQVDILREQVIKEAKRDTIERFVSAVTVNEKGKQVLRSVSMFSEDEKEREDAIRQNMLKQSISYHDLCAESIIEQVRKQINLDHNVRLDDFFQIVNNNPFVPEGREILYARGLKAGMDGDFVVTAHLLIPQIEHTMRYILAQKGVITSGIDSDGVQNEYDLNKTLYNPEIKKCFGEDVSFDLKGLLVESAGANLRNRMAHGLMSHDSFYSMCVPYLWHLVLKLCCIPLIDLEEYEKEKQEPHENGGTKEEKEKG